MKYIYSFLSVLLLISCNNNQSKYQGQMLEDSIAHAKQIEIDKAKKMREDSLSVIAWGDLKFGISKEEALKTVSLKNGDVDGDIISMDFETRFALERAFGLKELGQFDAIFNEDELSFIKIQSAKVSATHIDDLVDDCNIFVNNFEKKIGKPITLIEEEVNVFSFNEGENFTFAEFSIGYKYIIISLGETYSGSEYFYKIDIDNWQYPKKKHKETPEEMHKRGQEQKEREEIINNSF